MIATQDDGTTWEKAPELTEEEKAAKAKTNEERILLKRQKRDEDAKQKELEVMATQWAKREYLRKSLKRAVSVKEEDFIEVVWDRAMFEADLKYRTMKGQSVNESEERTEFREAQEKKKKEAYSAERERWDKMAYEELEPPQDKSITLGL